MGKYLFRVTGTLLTGERPGDSHARPRPPILMSAKDLRFVETFVPCQLQVADALPTGERLGDKARARRNC